MNGNRLCFSMRPNKSIGLRHALLLTFLVALFCLFSDTKSAIADEFYFSPISSQTEASLRNAWFKDFPKAEGFPAVFQAFNSFFERPRWQQFNSPFSKGSSEIMITFIGYAFYNDIKAKFTAYLTLVPKKHEVRFNTFNSTGAFVNGQEVNNITLLNAIYMND